MTYDRSTAQDRERLFLDLTLSALREMERVGARPGYSPFVRIWDCSPHSVHRSWLIQVPGNDLPSDAAATVLERSWDSAGDRERLLRDPRRRPRVDATMGAREARLPMDQFSVLRQFASGLELPLLELREVHAVVQPAQYGIDGFRPGPLRTKYQRVRLEWGADPSAEMKPVAMWTAQLRSLCQSCFTDPALQLQAAEPSGLCSLCRRKVGDDIRRCPACGVVYHEECWTYVGGCAVYGCTGMELPR